MLLSATLSVEIPCLAAASSRGTSILLCHPHVSLFLVWFPPQLRQPDVLFPVGRTNNTHRAEKMHRGTTMVASPSWTPSLLSPSPGNGCHLHGHVKNHNAVQTCFPAWTLSGSPVQCMFGSLANQSEGFVHPRSPKIIPFSHTNSTLHYFIFYILLARWLASFDL